MTAPGEVGLTALATPIRPGIRLTELASLRDLGEQDLVGKLGKPDFMREDAAAEIWQYRSDACVLELFLYPSADGKLKVEHVVSHSRTRLDGPIDQCVPFGTSVASAS